VGLLVRRQPQVQYTSQIFNSSKWESRACGTQFRDSDYKSTNSGGRWKMSRQGKRIERELKEKSKHDPWVRKQTTVVLDFPTPVFRLQEAALLSLSTDVYETTSCALSINSQQQALYLRWFTWGYWAVIKWTLKKLLLVFWCRFKHLVLVCTREYN
jgi:hypothetical protein